MKKTLIKYIGIYIIPLVRYKNGMIIFGNNKFSTQKEKRNKKYFRRSVCSKYHYRIYSFKMKKFKLLFKKYFLAI